MDALADVFRATDVAKLLENFGRATRMQDPIIHFYETFLAQYNPKLRKSRGVWYRPEPVVDLIVRTVDEILKTEFGLPQGLADTSKTTLEVDTQVPDKRSKSGHKRKKQEVHKVQILDPAAGTGTFLAKVIEQVHQKFQGQEGLWSKYVEEHLIPRLHGFEILMASYAMAHLKLDLLLRETGYIPKTQQRFRIFLTNSLEEAHPDTGTLFASWLSREAIEANYIKRDTPVMVVLGNPPYSVSSSNKGEWIQNLFADYKRDLNEKKLNLDDDYIKFIRYGEYFIEKNGEGVLAYITNNSFLDGITHRQMRQHLLETFDKIYIFDLHGNSKRKEKTPKGGKDDNVFDIMPGVSINLFVKTNNKRSGALGIIYHFNLYGVRELKYEMLLRSSINSIDWLKLKPQEPYFFFVPQNYQLEENYKAGFSINSIFKVCNSGLTTDRDNLFFDFDRTILQNRIEELYLPQRSTSFIEKYRVKDSSSYKILSKISETFLKKTNIHQCLYRPFDYRWLYYEVGITSRPAWKVMTHLIEKPNYAFICLRQSRKGEIGTFFIGRGLVSKNAISLFDVGTISPLYLYPEDEAQQTLGGFQERKPNLNDSIVQQIAKKIGLRFTSEKEETGSTFAPIDLLDYIYAALHSPSYRETYKESLKIDFPRIPFPKDAGTFWKLVELGGERRRIHLLESPKVEQYVSSYPQDGENIVTRKITKKDYELDEGQAAGRVWINNEQYFDQVPKLAWDFYIGGYQPAQKWLKDRRGRELSFDDILHYQKIIVALCETDRLMQAIDAVDFME